MVVSIEKFLADLGEAQPAPFYFRALRGAVNLAIAMAFTSPTLTTERLVALADRLSASQVAPAAMSATTASLGAAPASVTNVHLAR